MFPFIILNKYLFLCCNNVIIVIGGKHEEGIYIIFTFRLWGN